MNFVHYFDFSQRSGPQCKPHVVYWNNIPAPYMVDRFNAIAQRGNFDFEAWFNAASETGRSWEVNEAEWVFKYRYVPSFKFASRQLHFPMPLFGRNLPDILVMLYSEPVFLFGWIVARLRGVRTAFRTLVTFDSWVRRQWYKEYVKKFIFSRVDGVETTGTDGGHFAKKYGTPSDKIFYAAHAFDIEHFKRGRKAALKMRDIVRSTLGLRGVTFVYVGRLWHGKGLTFLLEAFHKLQMSSDKSVSLLLIGDGPEENTLREICREKKIKNVIFAGFIQKPELPTLYAVSDVFVFPTLGDPYGLAVDEAMACSLPVISSSSAGEIRKRVEDGLNGYIVPPGNSEALFEKMNHLTSRPTLRLVMGSRSYNKIKGHTPERWAEDFEKAVAQILTYPK